LIIVCRLDTGVLIEVWFPAWIAVFALSFNIDNLVLPVTCIVHASVIITILEAICFEEIWFLTNWARLTASISLQKVS
jgi:hypothetical protein